MGSITFALATIALKKYLRAKAKIKSIYKQNPYPNPNPYIEPNLKHYHNPNPNPNSLEILKDWSYCRWSKCRVTVSPFTYFSDTYDHWCQE